MFLAENYDDVCKIVGDAKATQTLQAKFKEVAQRYQETEAAANKWIKQIKVHDPNRASTVEDELKVLASNFKVYQQLMKSNPMFCERFLEELKHSIDYFVHTYLVEKSTTVHH